MEFTLVPGTGITKRGGFPSPEDEGQAHGGMLVTEVTHRFLAPRFSRLCCKLQCYKVFTFKNGNFGFFCKLH